MNKIELIQEISDVVCEDCGYFDCGDKPEDCIIMQKAIKLFDDYLTQMCEEDPEEEIKMESGGLVNNKDYSGYLRPLHGSVGEIKGEKT